MCYKGKCFFCIPVENGCLVFAVLSAIFTLLSLLSCITIGLLALTGLIFVSNEVDHKYHNIPDVFRDEEHNHALQTVKTYGGVAISVITLIASLPSLIAFIFSVLLCNGICKRRPGQVKAYFVYGVVITVLAVIAALIHFARGGAARLGLELLGVFGIYSLLLWMVFETYAKLRAGAVFKDHIRIVVQ